MSPDQRHEELLAQYQRANAVADDATRLYSAAHRARQRIALELMELEGRGSCPAAEWIRAHLAGKREEAERIRAEFPTSYFLDEPQSITGEALPS